MGRPKKVSVKKLISEAEGYIQNADPPIVAEYARMHGITRSYLYQLAKKEEEEGRPELSNAIKSIVDAKEVKLVLGGLHGSYKTAMAIFLLKQLGYRDFPVTEAGKKDVADPDSGVILIPEASADEEQVIIVPDGTVSI